MIDYRTPAPLHTAKTRTIRQKATAENRAEFSNKTMKSRQWGTVPGFNNELRVSTDGWVHQFNVKHKKWFEPSLPEPHPIKGYVIFNHRGKRLRVHDLMGITFMGPRPTPSSTVDHIEKFEGDHIRERSANFLSNLRWATKRQQSLNRNIQEPRRDGRCVIVWKSGTDKSSAECFPSILSASELLGLHCISMKKVALGEWNQTKGYHVEFCDLEPQLLHDDEEFRQIEGFWVSQYGRAKDVRTGSFSLSPKRTKGIEYAMISRGDGDGKSVAYTFHILVAMAFPDIVGPCPGDGYTVDHIDRDKSNNKASNLRWATLETQQKNQTRTESMHKKKKLGYVVEFKAPGDDTWHHALTQHDAVKAIKTLYDAVIPQATISLSLKKNPRGRMLSHGKHKGWSFRAAI